MGLGIRGWRRVGLGKCKVGGVGSRIQPRPLDLVFCSAFHSSNTHAAVTVNSLTHTHTHTHTP